MRGLALVSVDVGGTLLALGGPGAASRALASVDNVEQRAELRERLLTRRLEPTEQRELRTIAPSGPPKVCLKETTACALAWLAERVAVVTLSNTTSLDADGQDPLAERFPRLRRYRSFEIGFAKPDPRAFLAVLTREGAEPTRTVHVGDSWYADVEGAISAGLQAVWISDQSPRNRPPGLLGVASDFAAAVRLLDQSEML